MPLSKILDWLTNEGRSAKTDEAERRVKELESKILNDRMAAIEKASSDQNAKISDLNTKVFDSQKWIGTALIGSASFVLIILGVWSKLDMSHMEKRIDNAITNMQGQFALLAGEALKRPVIQINYQGKALNGEVFEVTPSNPSLLLGVVFLRNDGAKMAEHITIRLNASTPIPYVGYWNAVRTSDTNYPNCMSWETPVSINANDEYALEMGPLNPGDFKLQVYYNGTNSIANFKVAVKK